MRIVENSASFRCYRQEQNRAVKYAQVLFCIIWLKIHNKLREENSLQLLLETSLSFRQFRAGISSNLSQKFLFSTIRKLADIF